MKILTTWKVGEKIRPGIVLNGDIDNVDPLWGWRYSKLHHEFDELLIWIPQFQPRQLEVARDCIGMIYWDWDNNIEI